MKAKALVLASVLLASAAPVIGPPAPAARD
jgi:hypothetical protein